jgi:hypothetical protein
VREARTQEEKEFLHPDVSEPATHMQGLIFGKTPGDNVYTRLGRFTIQWSEFPDDVKEVQNWKDWKDWKDSFRIMKVIVI